MHVGCDAAECHRHILGYLKIDLAAFVCVRACVRARRSVASGPRCLFIIVLFIFHALIFYFFFAPPLLPLARMRCCSTRNRADTPIHVLSLSLSFSRTYARTHGRTDGRTDAHTSTPWWLCKSTYSSNAKKKRNKINWGDDMFPLTMLDNQRLLNCIPLSPPAPQPPSPSCWRPIVRLGGTVEDAGDSSQSCGLCILLWSVHS